MSTNTKELRLSGNARDFNWMQEKQKAGKLYMSGDKITKPIFDKLRVFIKLANDIYKNAWDLDVETMPDDKVDIKGLVVHFPEVIIRNRNNKRHTIKDLFIKIPFHINDRNIYVDSPMGGRTTWTYAEWTSDYSHSHLSGIGRYGPLPFWGRFCTGSGHINDYIAQLNAGEFSEELVTSLLVQLMGLASYESIEGTPYRYISNIYARTNNGSRFSLGSDTYKRLHTKLINHYRENSLTPILEFGVETGKYFVKDNAKFDDYLNSVELDESEKRIYLSFVDNTGTAWRYDATPNNVDINTRGIEPYVFRSQELPINITNLRQEEENITYKIHPQIKEQIKKEIEYEINRKTIRKSTVDKYQSKISDARKSTEPDKVLVQANS